MKQPLRPLMLGIAGDSGSGKTTLTSGLLTLVGGRLFGAAETTVICLDDYHKYDRQERQRRGLTALNPACNYLDIMAQHLQALRQGQPILKPVYNHATGCFEPPEYVQPTRLIIVEGLLTLSTPALQRCFDLTVYLDPDERLRHRWKIQRDTALRGYTERQVIESLARRMPDSEQYIWPQKKAADLVVRFWPPYGYFDEQVDNARLNVRLFQRHSLPQPNWQEVLAHAQNGRKPALRLEPNIWSGGQLVDILDIDGGLALEKASELEAVIVQHWRQRQPLSCAPSSDAGAERCLGDFREGALLRHSEPLALTQLLLADYLVSIHQQQPSEPMALPEPIEAFLPPLLRGANGIERALERRLPVPSEQRSSETKIAESPGKTVR